MLTPFAARDAKNFASLAKAFGETFTFTAMAVAGSGDVNSPKVADGAKPPLTVVGIWESLSEGAFPTARGSNPDDDAMSRGASSPSVIVLTSSLTWMPTRGCLCTRLFDGAVYEVGKPLPDAGCTLFKLTGRRKP